MKDKDLRKALSEYAGTPDYMKKDAFIKSMRKDMNDVKVSGLKMVLTQARYIRIYMWILSVAILIIPLFSTGKTVKNVMNIMTMIMPFFAGLGVFEAMRAKMHKMFELESVTLLSGKGAFFARMVAIGSVQFVVITFVSIIFSRSMDSGVIMIAVQLIIPFALTNTICFILERTSFGRDNVWSCLAVSGIVFVMRETIKNMPGILKIDHRVFMLLAAVLLVLQVVEFNKTVKMEKLAWS